jgi:hypothetical protein
MCVLEGVAGQQHVHRSRARLQQMTRDAKTAEKIRLLAEWYHAEEQLMRARAQAQSDELERIRRSPFGFSTKYPSPADTARALCDCYIYGANVLAGTAVNLERQFQSRESGGQSSLDPADALPANVFPRRSRYPTALRN